MTTEKQKATGEEWTLGLFYIWVFGAALIGGAVILYQVFTS